MEKRLNHRGEHPAKTTTTMTKTTASSSTPKARGVLKNNRNTKQKAPQKPPKPKSGQNGQQTMEHYASPSPKNANANTAFSTVISPTQTVNPSDSTLEPTEEVEMLTVVPPTANGTDNQQHSNDGWKTVKTRAQARAERNKQIMAQANALLEKEITDNPTKKTNDADDGFTIFRIDAKVSFPEATPEERTNAHREFCQAIIDTTEKVGISIWLRPLQNAKGPRAKFMAPRFRFEGAEQQIGTLGIYSNEWASKPEQKYSRSTISLCIEVNSNMTNWYSSVAVALAAKQIEIKPKRLTIKTNAVPIAIIHPAVYTLESELLQAKFHDTTGLNVTFTPGITNAEGKWSPSRGPNDKLIQGIVALAPQSSCSDARKKLMELFPIKNPDRTAREFLGGNELKAFPLNSQAILMDKISKSKQLGNIIQVMQEEYIHSKNAWNGKQGGLFNMTLAKDILSLDIPLTRKNNNTETCLREFFLEQTAMVDNEGDKERKLFSYVSTTVKTGQDEEAEVITRFVAARSGSTIRTARIGQAASNWLNKECKKALLETFGKEALKEVITEHITQEISLDEWEDDEDYDQLEFEVNLTDLGDSRDGDSIFGDTGDGISTIGDKSTTSIKTTQSTRDALAAAQASNQQKQLELQQKEQEIQAKAARVSRLRDKFKEHLRKGLISQAEYDAEFGEEPVETPPNSQSESVEVSPPSNTRRSTPVEGVAANG